MQLGTFGDIVFETSADRVRTWQELQRQGSARFAEHEVLHRKPRLEFLGPGLEAMTIKIRLDAQLGLDPLTEIDALRFLRDAGEEKVLIIGGQIFGRFVLADLTEEHRRHGRDGVLLLAEVVLQLKEYDDGN